MVRGRLKRAAVVDIDPVAGKAFDPEIPQGDVAAIGKMERLAAAPEDGRAIRLRSLNDDRSILRPGHVGQIHPALDSRPAPAAGPSPGVSCSIAVPQLPRIGDTNLRRVHADKRTQEQTSVEHTETRYRHLLISHRHRLVSSSAPISGLSSRGCPSISSSRASGSRHGGVHDLVRRSRQMQIRRGPDRRKRPIMSLKQIAERSDIAVGLIAHPRAAEQVVGDDQPVVGEDRADQAVQPALRIVDRVVQDPAVLRVDGHDAGLRGPRDEVVAGHAADAVDTARCPRGADCRVAARRRSR